jgi:hypothetical protein
MNLRLVVGVLAIVGVSVCGLVCTFVNFEIVDRVNENLPADKQYSWIGWHAEKTGRLFSDYRKFLSDWWPNPKTLLCIGDRWLLLGSFCVGIQILREVNPQLARNRVKFAS